MTTEATLDELETACAAGDAVLDVRESDEYAEGHVPSARLMPPGIVPVRAHELPSGTPVYVVCASGGRSAQAAQILQRAGVDARSVAGGTNAWIRSAAPSRPAPRAPERKATR
jgi:rhodanese-related sulfurtransferase